MSDICKDSEQADSRLTDFLYPIVIAHVSRVQQYRRSFEGGASLEGLVRA